MHKIIKTHSIYLLKKNVSNIHMMGSILIFNSINISCEYAAKFLDVWDLNLHQITKLLIYTNTILVKTEMLYTSLIAQNAENNTLEKLIGQWRTDTLIIGDMWGERSWTRPLAITSICLDTRVLTCQFLYLRGSPQVTLTIGKKESLII